MKYRLLLISIVVCSCLAIVCSQESFDTVTKEEAEKALNQSYAILVSMQEQNFSVEYVNDTLLQAEKVFLQAYYASILIGEINGTLAEKKEAESVLKFISLENTSYSHVLAYTDEIKTREQEAILLFDSLISFQISLKNVYGDNLSVIESIDSVELFTISFDDFYNDRYEESRATLLSAKEAFENEKSEQTTLAIISSNSKNFIMRNWLVMSIALLFICIGLFIAIKKSRKKYFSKRVKLLEEERVVLMKLIKKAQKDRFKTGVISSLTYSIRIKKYHERLRKIREELPALRHVLKKVSKPHKKR